MNDVRNFTGRNFVPFSTYLLYIVINGVFVAVLDQWEVQDEPFSSAKHTLPYN